MKRIVIVFSFFLVLFLLSSCNADFLSAFGEWAEDLRDSGFVEVGESQADNAFEAAKALRISINENFKVKFPLTTKYDLRKTFLVTRFKENPTSGQYEFEREAFFRVSEEGESVSSKEDVLTKVENLIKAIALLKEVEGSDVELRKILEDPYKGITSSRPCHRNLYDIVTGSETYAKDFYPILTSAVSGISLEDLENLKNFNSPIPLQTFDFSILFPTLNDCFTNLKKTMPLPSSSSEPAGPNPYEFLMEFFLEFLNEIENSVGDRDYKIICDEFTLFIVLGMLQDLDQILLERVAYGSRFGASDDISWILANCREELDGILGGIDAIAYMYGIESDSSTLMKHF